MASALRYFSHYFYSQLRRQFFSYFRYALHQLLQSEEICGCCIRFKMHYEYFEYSVVIIKNRSNNNNNIVSGMNFILQIARQEHYHD